MTELLLQSELLNMQIELWVLHLTPGFLPLNLNKFSIYMANKDFSSEIISKNSVHSQGWTQVPNFGR